MTKAQTKIKDKEIRSYTFNIRAFENEQYGHYIEGLAVVYELPADLGDFTEIIRQGALNGTDLKDVKFLVNHDTNMIPLARSRNNNQNSTMQLSINPEGLKIRVNLDIENNAQAAALYSAVQRGDIDQMSFMFIITDEEWQDLDTDHPTRVILSIGKVFEVSAVTFPAYEQTTLSARNQNSVLESARKSLESERKQRRNALLLEKMKNKNKGVC